MLRPAMRLWLSNRTGICCRKFRLRSVCVGIRLLCSPPSNCLSEQSAVSDLRIMSAASDMNLFAASHLLIETRKRDAVYYSLNNTLINICSVMSRRKVQEAGSIPVLSGTLFTLLREQDTLQGFDRQFVPGTIVSCFRWPEKLDLRSL
jgi:hypothetical protein